MKFKGAKSMIMSKFFAFLSFTTFLMVMCVSDIPQGESLRFLLTASFSILMAILAVVVFDPKILLRHVFATGCIFYMVIGLLLKKNSIELEYLSRCYCKLGSMREFYSYILKQYNDRSINNEKS